MDEQIAKGRVDGASQGASTRLARATRTQLE